MLKAAWDAAQAIIDADERGKQLLAIAPHLPNPERTQALEQALTAVQSIENAFKRVEALIAIAPQLPKPKRTETLAQALSLADGIESASSRAQALVAIAPELPDLKHIETLEQAVIAAQAMKFGEYGLFPAQILAIIAHRLPEPASTQKMAQAVESLAETLASGDFLETFEIPIFASELAKIDPQLLDPLITAVGALPDEKHRDELLTGIIHHLTETTHLPLLSAALSIAPTIEDDGNRGRALTAIACRLPATAVPLLEQLLAAAHHVHDQQTRSVLLAEIATRFTAAKHPPALEQALSIANSIQEDTIRADVLIAIALHSIETAPRILEQILNIAAAIQDDSICAQMLMAIVPHLPTTATPLLDQALTAARTIQDPERRGYALLGLPNLPEEERFQALDQILTTVYAVQSELPRTQALAAVAPHLPATERFQAFEQALTAITQTRAGDVYDANCALHEIIPKLPHTEPQLFQRALHVAQDLSQTIENDWYCHNILITLLCHLSETASQLLEQALAAVVQALSDKSHRAEVLAKLLPQLPPAIHLRTLEYVIQALEQLVGAEQGDYDQQSCAETLATIAPYLPATVPQLFRRALDIAQTIQNGKYRAATLTAIAPYFPDPAERLSVLERILTVVRVMTDQQAWARTLATITPHLPPTECNQALQEALAMGRAMDNPTDQGYTLLAIAPYFPEPERLQVLAEILSVAPKIRDENRRGGLLQRLGLAGLLAQPAPQSPDTELQLLETILQIASAIRNEQYRATVLQAIAPYLPPNTPHLLEAALAAAQTIQDEQIHADALAAIAPTLPATELSEASEQPLSAASIVQDEKQRVESLMAIALQLPETQSDKAWTEAFNAARSLTDDSARFDALVKLAPQLPNPAQDQAWTEALDATAAIPEPINRVHALMRIAPHLPEPQCLIIIKQALAELQTIPNEQQLPYALKDIAPHLTIAAMTDQQAAALALVPHLPQDTDKTWLLSELAPKLSIGLMPNALRLIETAFSRDRDKVETLCNLLPYLPTDQLPNTLNLIVQSIPAPYPRTEALESLIPLLSINTLTDALSLIEVYQEVSGENSTLTESIQTSSPFETVAASAAIADSPKLETIKLPMLQTRILSSIATALASQTAQDSAPKAPTDVITKLATQIATVTPHLKAYPQPEFAYDKAAAEIFSRLAPAFTYLEIPQRQIFFEAVQQFQDPAYQAQVLSAVARIGSTDLLVQVNQCLASFNGDDYRTWLNIKVRTASLSSFDRPTLAQLLSQIQSPHRKAEALVEIASHPSGHAYQPAALRQIRGLGNHDLEVRCLKRLIPRLHHNQRLEAANVIREIGELYFRTTALVALACKFPEFRSEAKTSAQQLSNLVQSVEQLSTLAIEMPEILPEVTDIAATVEQPLARGKTLVALSPHLPMRINREVTREHRLGQPITIELWQRALYLMARGYRDALKGGSLRNESAQDEDLLNLKDEVNALADLLLMRDLEPPMTVGILGGWGGGKSYIMHLMQSRMTEIRSRPIHPDTEAWNLDPNHERLSPYVGHVYQIKFDAWTFAKSDLWASLMQTIFLELNRQISLEQKLARVLAEQPNNAESRAKVLCAAGQYWPVLYKSGDEDRQWFLERVLSPEQLAQFQDINNQEEVDNALWQQLGETYQAENQKLKELEAELKRKQAALQQETQAIRSKIDNDQFYQLINKLTGPISILLSNRVSKTVFEQINQEITRKIKAQLDSDAASETLEPIDTNHLKAMIRLVTADVMERRYGQIDFFSFWTWCRKNVRLLGLVLILMVLAIVLPIAVEQTLAWLDVSIDSFSSRLIAFLAPLTPGIVSVQALFKSFHQWFEETKLAVKEYEIQIGAISQQLEKRREEIFQNQLDEVEAISELETEIKVLEDKIDTQRQRIPENVYESLEAFVSDRLQAGSYEKHLGLMQQVKGDLADLSQRLLPPPAASQAFRSKVEQLQKIFPRGPARIIVYIDDLDRCPPDRVVAVLEAVQLLVKTPLFIAVLAIDERYITRALEQFYKGILLRHGSPSGTDYLEKIIQLPYRVRPIMANTLETYLRSQVVIQDNATGSAKFNEFSRQEFNMLLECCKQTDLSPRTLKRLINIYKLFKIVCRTRGTKPSPQVQQAILALLALSGHYPDLMRGIFDDIENCYEEQRTQAEAEKSGQKLHLESPLQDCFKHYRPPGDRYLRREFDHLKHDALQTTILPPALTLEGMTHEIFNLLRSFSFVGDIGEDPEDYRVSDAVEAISK
ncbi:MAG: P-loop NTPase fold protein [Cyanobacteria bacterium J06642_9]